MYFFGLSKEEVLSQKHVVSYKETFKQNPLTLFGRQVKKIEAYSDSSIVHVLIFSMLLVKKHSRVYDLDKILFKVYPVNSKSSKSVDGSMKMKDIDLRLPADHYAYVETRFHSAFEADKDKEALATNWSGKRDPRVVIDLEELPITEDADSVSYVTVRSPETKPSCLADQISSNILDQSLVEDGSAGLLDLNTTPDDELVVSETHFCFLQDLNCPYMEETETSCEKSVVVDDGPTPTPLSSPKCQNVDEKDGTESPASYTSCCTTEHSLRTRTLDPSCRTRLEFPVSPENEHCNKEEEEFSQVIQMAAESLVHISTVSYQNQDFQDNPEKGDVETRCCPCDSYELHTLGISETNTEEEFCVSSMALDKLNNITRDDNKEFGLKLRRGRRMKHFQKEILPSLTSLSRHEIREDMNILEAVFRSREYKKMQGRTNARNKRSVSQRYVGKRR